MSTDLVNACLSRGYLVLKHFFVCPVCIALKLDLRNPFFKLACSTEESLPVLRHQRSRRTSFDWPDPNGRSRMCEQHKNVRRTILVGVISLPRCRRFGCRHCCSAWLAFVKRRPALPFNGLQQPTFTPSDDICNFFDAPLCKLAPQCLGHCIGQVHPAHELNQSRPTA